MKRKLVTFLLALCAVFTVGALSACGESNSTGGANNGEQTGGENTTPETPDNGDENEEHVHNYVSVVTPPTCTEQGYATYTCECGDSYQDDEVAALGHTFDNDCTTADKCVNCNIVTEAEHVYKDKVCSVCGDIEYTEGLAYTLINDGTAYEVSGRGECTDAEVIIPATYDDIPVTSIGYRAFADFTDLISITIPNSITTIGQMAFADCTGLTSIIIPDSVTSIGQMAFTDCSGLVNITMGKGVTSIGNQAFNHCTGLISITIPEGVTTMDSCFFHCENLKSVTLPNSITKIGLHTFGYCYKLENITLPNKLTTLGESAFTHCYNLTKITIPDSVTTIERGAFYSCYGLTSVILSSNLTTIESDVFGYCSSLTSITIPDKVTSIGEKAFSDCYKLVEVINKSVLPIEVGSTDNGYVGYYAKQILQETPKISNFIEKDDYIFYNANGSYYLLGYEGTDTVLTLPNDIQGHDYEIYQYAFSRCYSLTSITIPDSVTSIGENAFEACDKLVEVINKSSLPIATGSEDNGYIGYYAKQVITDEKDSKIIKENDYIFYNDNGDYYLLGYEGMDTVLTLPNDIQGYGYEIYQYAFYECDSLTSITIPDSVTYIGGYAFYYCDNLQTVTFGKNSQLTSIGNYAFYYCDNLTSIIIPDSVTSIGWSAFYCCSSLDIVYYGGTNEQWTAINKWFNNSSLTTAMRYDYSEIEPALNAEGTAYDGNYWHYGANGEIIVWKK